MIINLIFYYYFFLFFLKKKEHFSSKTIHIKNIFKTTEEQNKGLMYRKKIPDNKGFMFIYKKPRIVSFWMKNTFVPLDIIFIDENKTVVDIKKNMIPHDTTSYTSKHKVMYAVK